MTPAKREIVYAKYNGHCAYCGCEITIKEMQVEHIIPKSRNGTDDLNNLTPSCKTCNTYKRYERYMPQNEPLEAFRELLKTLHERVLKIFLVKVALKYGVIKFIKPFDDKFYFEKLGEKND